MTRAAIGNSRRKLLEASAHVAFPEALDGNTIEWLEHITGERCRR